MYVFVFFQVTLNKFEHTCASTGRIKSSMANYHWVAEKAAPIFKRYPNMGSKELKGNIEEKYNVTLSYWVVWKGRQKAMDHIYGKWEESFGMLLRFKAEVEKRSPGSVVKLYVHIE